MRRRISPASAAIITLLSCAILLPPGDLHAQASTGKIQGRVLSSVGPPLASAQVTIDGTNLGNITNDEGYYFVNEVPPGLVTVRVQSIGYRAAATTGQRVLAGQTTTLDFSLEQTAVELAPVEVIGERDPLVPRDQVATKAIVTGDAINELPIDFAANILLLSPGVVETNTGVSMRGSREGEHAVYVDGVPLRELLDGGTSYMQLPTNALAQVDVTTGGISSRYGNAQSGLVNYVTRTGPARLGGAVSFFTDDLAPKEWRTGFNRVELNVGGPALFEGLRWFLGGTAEGRRYYSMPQGFNGLTRYVPSGVDTVIRLARTSQTPGGFDSVDVVIPDYVEWDHGPTSPSQVSDRLNYTAKLSYGLGRGSRVDLTHYRSRRQSLNRGWLRGPFNPDSWTGNHLDQTTTTLGAYFLLRQSAEQAVALDVKLSRQRDWYQYGSVHAGYLEGGLHPPLGFNLESIDFVLEPENWPVNERLIHAARADLLQDSDLVLLPGRDDLTARQGVEGVVDNLRLNPYALRLDFPVSGPGNVPQTWELEGRWYGTAAIDWQTGRANRLWLGGELTVSEAAGRTVSLITADWPSQFLRDAAVAGVFLQDRLDLGDLVLEAGLRLDYFSPDGEFPRVPGYVFNVPDSLTADRWTAADGEGPVLDRLRAPTGDCGGSATVAERTNTNGDTVCVSNFSRAETQTILNPRLAVSFPVTAKSTFRLSYGHNSQAPSLNELFRAAELDLGSGQKDYGFGRDVGIPTTVAFEAGYRQLLSASTVIDVSVYSRTTRNGLNYRLREYRNPVTGAPFLANVLDNADHALTRGADVVFRRRLGEAFDVSVNYSFLDARGTGSNPWDAFATLARTRNLGPLLGGAPDPPDVMRRLDQSRTHTVSGTASLRTGSALLPRSRLLHALVGELGAFATLRVSSGLPYTRCINQGMGETGPPMTDYDGCSTKLAEATNTSRTPMEKRFDVRLAKEVQVLGTRSRLFADFRNPLGLTNLDKVFLETGTAENALYRREFIDGYLSQSTWDGDAHIDDFNIRTECETSNPVNQYLVLQAERRFGDGDGVFTVAEQRRMIGDYYNLWHGPQTLRDSNRYLRLGFELVF